MLRGVITAVSGGRSHKLDLELQQCSGWKDMTCRDNEYGGVEHEAGEVVD
jgi:hypothetical protein